MPSFVPLGKQEERTRRSGRKRFPHHSEIGFGSKRWGTVRRSACLIVRNTFPIVAARMVRYSEAFSRWKTLNGLLRSSCSNLEGPG